MRLSHLAKLSGALLLTTGLAGTASAQSYNYAQNGYSAHEACKTDENRGKIIGGGLGAVAGAVIGSQVAGNGARTEASVLGGVIGGLAGAGIADKRVDCDPVYSTGRPVTYGTSQGSTTYSSSPTYTTSSTSYGTSSSLGHHQTASYPGTDYGVRTTISDHPVYSDPTYGAQSSRTYVTQTQPQPVRTVHAVSHPSYTQPTYASSTTRYVSSAPATSYVRPVTTTYVQPTTYVRPYRGERQRHRAHAHGHHHHGKYACSDRH